MPKLKVSKHPNLEPNLDVLILYFFGYITKNFGIMPPLKNLKKLKKFVIFNIIFF